METFDLHAFWIETFPYFISDAYFIYYILDLLSILTFLKIIFALPGFMLGFSKKDRGFRI